MEKGSLEDFTCEQIIITSNKEIKSLRGEGRLYQVLSLLIAPLPVIFFYNVDYLPASTDGAVLLGLGVFAGGYSIYCFLHGRSLSREASRLEQRILEQKIFEERPEQADDAQENYHCRQ